MIILGKFLTETMLSEIFITLVRSGETQTTAKFLVVVVIGNL